MTHRNTHRRSIFHNSAYRCCYLAPLAASEQSKLGIPPLWERSEHVSVLELAFKTFDEGVGPPLNIPQGCDLLPSSLPRAWRDFFAGTRFSSFLTLLAHAGRLSRRLLGDLDCDRSKDGPFGCNCLASFPAAAACRNDERAANHRVPIACLPLPTSGLSFASVISLKTT